MNNQINFSSTLKILQQEHNEVEAINERIKEKNRAILTDLCLTRNELFKVNEPACHVGEVIQKIDEEKYLVKVASEGKYIVRIKPLLKAQIEKGDIKIPHSKDTKGSESSSANPSKEEDASKQRKQVSLRKFTLPPGTKVALHNDNFQIEKLLNMTVDPAVALMRVEKTSNLGFDSVGGLDEQIKQISEVIELPIKRPEIFESLGISQPKGVLLYGPPGTGKTLVAKAVAHSTDCTFIRVSGSELVQKYIGEGTRLVRELFNMAKQQAPSIIFMDEVDSIGSKRGSKRTGGESEVQRTMLELLNQLDGFDPTKNVKIIMATNRVDVLDPALLRPGRIDRKIEFPKPNKTARLAIFKIHTKRMTLDKNVDMDYVAENAEGASGAEIKAICTEAGMFALREQRDSVGRDDFELAVNKVLKKNELFENEEKKMWI